MTFHGDGYNFTVKLSKDLILRIKTASLRDGNKYPCLWASRVFERDLRQVHPDLGRAAIFLDDERAPPEGQGWAVARSYEAFRGLLGQIDPIAIAFDHDLGADENGARFPDGYQCMRALIDLATSQPTAVASLRLVIVHSANPVGRTNLRGLLQAAQRGGILVNVEVEDRPVTSFPISRWPPL